METTDRLLDYNVSYQASSWAKIESEKTIGFVLNQIKSGTLREKIEILREKLNAGDKPYYDKYKKWLPAVTFSATFNQRRQLQDLKNYNAIIVIDIDGLTEEQISKTSSLLLNDNYLFSFWRSPSNNGIKGLISVNYSLQKDGLNYLEYHKQAFRKITSYFDEKYNLQIDLSGSDVTRLCFLSSDPCLILKRECYSFLVEEKDLTESPMSNPRKKEEKKYFISDRDALHNPNGKNDKSDRKIMSDIIRHLNNKGLSITYTYDEWFKVAMAIANTFTFDVGLKYFTKLSAMDSDKFVEVECENFLANCYETSQGKVTFNSLVYLANAKGYKTKFQKNGVPKAEG